MAGLLKNQPCESCAGTHDFFLDGDAPFRSGDGAEYDCVCPVTREPLVFAPAPGRPYYVMLTRPPGAVVVTPRGSARGASAAEGSQPTA